MARIRGWLVVRRVRRRGSLLVLSLGVVGVWAVAKK